MANNNFQNIAIVGMMGSGKTTMAKKIVGRRAALVFDVNNEYTGTNFTRHTEGNFSAFLDEVLATRGKFVIFEESTAFVRGNMAAKFFQIMVNKRHTQNNYIFLFHNICSIPKNVLPLLNFVIIHKTADIYKEVEKKYPRLLKAWLKTMASKNPYENTIVKTI